MHEPGVDQPPVGGDECEIVHQGCRNEEPVDRILVRKVQAPALDGDLVGERRFVKREGFQHMPHPGRGIRTQLDAPSFRKDEDLPDHDGRKPYLVGRIVQGCRHVPAEPVWLEQAPEEDVGVQQEPQRLRSESSASHTFSSRAGLEMSPVIRPVPLRDPSHDSGRSPGGGGITCAIGTPRRVTRIGWPVRLTRSRSARQVALNFETGTRSIARVNLPWSSTMVKTARHRVPVADFC